MKHPYRKLILLATLTLGILFGPMLSSVASAQNGAKPTTIDPPARTCKELLLLGQLYYGRGQVAEAYAAFQLCLKQDPQNLEALHSVGRTEVRLQLYTAAIEHCKKALGIDPKFISAYLCLSQAYSGQYEDTENRNAARSQLDEALRLLGDAERAAGTNSDDKGKIANEKGRIYRLRGDFEKSITEFEKAAKLKPDDAIILSNLGSVQLIAGKTDDAVDSLRAAVEADPEDAISRAQYSRALRYKGDIKSALSESKQAYSRCGQHTKSKKCENPFVIGQYGASLYLSKSLALAKTTLEEAIAMDKGAVYHENFYFLGRTYLDLNQADEAKKQLSKAVTLSPSDGDYRLQLGAALEKSGDKAAACKEYNEAVKLNNKAAKDKVAALGCK